MTDGGPLDLLPIRGVFSFGAIIGTSVRGYHAGLVGLGRSPAMFTGTDDTLRNRHLSFDHVVD